MNTMAESLRFLVKKRFETSSIQVRYRTFDGETTISAIPCKSNKTSNDVMDLTVEANGVDFIVKHSDLKHDPREGDIIIAFGKKYIVSAKDTAVGNVAWKWCEGCYEFARRIYTKYIEDSEE